jgi:hypothetical protein
MMGILDQTLFCTLAYGTIQYRGPLSGLRFAMAMKASVNGCTLYPFTLAFGIYKDNHMKAFFSHQINDYVVDEMCVCGHLKSHHGSLLHKLKAVMVRDPSDGSCCSGHCDCTQYAFLRFVAVDEAARIVIEQRPLMV